MKLGVLGDDLPGIGFDALAPALAADKKRLDGEVRMVLPARIGAMAPWQGGWTWPVTTEELRHGWEGAR